MDMSMLNKGLSLKMGRKDPAQDTLPGERVIDLEVDKISPDPNQPRKNFDAVSIQNLASDIKNHGLISPIIVRTDGVGRYVIVAGERRWRAFQLLKEPTIKAIIRDTYKAENLGYIQVAENLRREDLKFYELAEFIIAKSDAGVAQKALADELGMSRSEVNRYMDWKDAPEFLKEAKEKFTSIRVFSDCISFAKKHPAEVEEFVKEEDRIVASTFAAFKKRIEEPENAAGQNVQDEGVSSNDEQVSGLSSGDSVENEAVAGEIADGENFSEGEAQIEEGLGGLDSADAFSSGGDGGDSGSSSAESSFDNGFEEQSDEGSSVNSEDSFSSFENGSCADTDEAADELLSDNGDEKIKKPLIIGSVEGREGYLQYKHRPTAEGMIWVKWEDGFEEEIIAEKFRINRITEE